MEIMIWLWAISAGLFAILGMYVAEQKGRNWLEGAILGVLFGVIGVLVVALLPSRETIETR